jgi:rRNA maturation RNase YbeY
LIDLCIKEKAKTPVYGFFVHSHWFGFKRSNAAIMDIPTINFFNEEVKFILTGKRKTREWILRSVADEGKRTGAINIIFCSDEYLYKLNLDYLNHDTYTDIITFDMSDNEDVISGDIFISIDRARDNAGKLKFSLQQEVQRLIIHGVLHLTGYSDKGPEDKALMTSKEDYYLSLLPKI